MLGGKDDARVCVCVFVRVSLDFKEIEKIGRSVGGLSVLHGRIFFLIR